jgi:hypothetical protein
VFDATIEAPVTIRNPDKPIGTHVFTAVARNGAGIAARGGGRGECTGATALSLQLLAHIEMRRLGKSG